MLKGLLLSLFLGIFGASLIVFISSSTGVLQENILTGNVIGISAVTNYAVAVSFVSLILVILIILWMKKH